MAQFHVYRLEGSRGLVVDCQSQILSDLKTRFVVPLLARNESPSPAQRLNPIFSVLGEEHVMATQFAAAVAVPELGEFVASLEGHAFEIIGALDVLITGV